MSLKSLKETMSTETGDERLESMNSEDKQILIQYLNNESFNYNGAIRFSTINAGLRECRLFTKRDKSTGKYDPNAEFGFVGHWLGAIGYFTILDQIGSSYKISGQETPLKYNKIEFALRNFGFDLLDNDERKLNALVALRNAFTHDFNLLNIPERENKYELQRLKFTVYPNPEEEKNIVTLSKTPWNGDIVGKDFHKEDDTTFINLFAFGTLVEEIVKRLVEKIDTNEIETIIDIKELINKYTFVTSTHIIKNTH